MSGSRAAVKTESLHRCVYLLGFVSMPFDIAIKSGVEIREHSKTYTPFNSCCCSRISCVCCAVPAVVVLEAIATSNGGKGILVTRK